MGLYEDVLKTVDVDKIVLEKCYEALEEILVVLNEEELDDKECFQRIEKIIEIYENLGCKSNTRHDFG